MTSCETGSDAEDVDKDEDGSPDCDDVTTSSERRAACKCVYPLSV